MVVYARRKFLLTCLLALGVLFAPHPVRAAQIDQTGQIGIQQILVDIWPEYDRPGVLVIYHISLTAETPLPVELSLRIPRSAGEPFTVATQDIDGMLYNVDYSSKPLDNDWLQVTFNTATPNVQLEYYDPRLSAADNRHTFEYQWAGDYLANSLLIRVQQPLHASNLQIVPNFDQTEVGDDGLTYYSSEIGMIKAGERFKIVLSYDKSDDQPSSSVQPVEPAAPLDPQEKSGSAWLNALPISLGFLGLLIIGGGGYWYWHAGKNGPRFAWRRTAAEQNSSENNLYCHNCGKRTEPGDLFCRSCGSKLKP